MLNISVSALTQTFLAGIFNMDAFSREINIWVEAGLPHTFGNAFRTFGSSSRRQQRQQHKQHNQQHGMEQLWHHTFYDEYRVAPEEHVVLLTVTPSESGGKPREHNVDHV